MIAFTSSINGNVEVYPFMILTKMNIKVKVADQLTKYCYRQGWEKPVFFKKNKSLGFFKKRIFWVFKKKQDFFLFLRKTEKPYSQLFYCIMQYHYFQNYTIIIVIPIMAFKIEGKEKYPICVFAKHCWSVHSFGKHAHSKQRKTTPTNSAVSSLTLCACPAIWIRW